MVKASVRTTPTPAPTPAAAIDVESTVISGDQSNGPDKVATPAADAGPEEIFRDVQGEPPVVGAVGSVAVTQRSPAAAQASSSQYTDDSGAVEGEMSDSDVRFPSLTIVQGSTGVLAQTYNTGDLVFGEELLFEAPKKNSPCPQLRFIPIKITKGYLEALSLDEMNAGLIPRRFTTVQEVESNNGLVNNYEGNGFADFRPFGRIVALLESPEGTNHPGFAMELDGKVYGLATINAKKGAYGRVVTPITSAFFTTLFEIEKSPEGDLSRTRVLHKFAWKYTWGPVQTKKGFNPWYPQVRQTKELSGPEVREFIRELSATVDQGADE
jgi:hypothetical protein